MLQPILLFRMQIDFLKILSWYLTTRQHQAGGDVIDKFLIQWSHDFSFTSFDTSITEDLSHLITSLKMGNLYYVRVFAHNSAGFGKADDAVPIKPMQSPDPPHLPRLFHLTNADSYSMGTSLCCGMEYLFLDR